MKSFLLSFFLTLHFCFSAFAQVNKPLTILDQPKPELPKDYGTLDAEGSIRFRVQFHANGQIGGISPVTSFIKRLDEKALEAVKKIKFDPEIKNGEPVNKIKIISYTYSWRNNGWTIQSPKIIQTKSDEKAEAIIKKAVENLGGEKYLNAKSQIGRGRFSVLHDGAIESFQTFIDVLAFPDKERTEFKGGAAKTVQVNTGKSGWIFDGNALTINEQTADQIKNFKRGVRASLDNLLRGNWRDEGAKLEYVGKRQASLGKRNDVVKLTFSDDFTVEFEFSDEGLPMKSVYKRTNADGEEAREEDRYAQFVNVNGIKTPYIIDHFSNDKQSSRANYESVEFNKQIPDSVFAKPSSVKDLKKDLKL